MIGAYREPDRKQGRELMTTLIESVSRANYIDRSLLESGGFRPLLHPQL